MKYFDKLKSNTWNFEKDYYYIYKYQINYNFDFSKN